MTEPDPLNRLSRVANQPEQPAPEFSDRLLDELLSELTANQTGPTGSSFDHTINETAMEVIMLSPDRNQPPARSRTWLYAGAAAAVVALVGGLLVISNRDTDQVPANQPQVTVTTPVDPDSESAPETAIPNPTLPAVEPTPGGAVEAASITIEHKLDVSARPIAGTFEVTEGADTLGCSRGTFVDDYDPAQDELKRVMTCSGSNTGTFTHTFDIVRNYTGPGDQNGPWRMLDATGDFTGLQGGGDWWAIGTTETITGDIEYTS
jgi:hypothetical protein